MQRFHNDLWAMRSQVCGLHICLWVFPFRSHSFHFPNILKPHRQIKTLFFSSSKNVFWKILMQILWTCRLNLVTNSGQCEYMVIVGKTMLLTNGNQTRSNGMLELALLLCCFARYRSLICIEAKMSITLEEQKRRKPAVRPSCGWKRLCGGGGVAPN